MRMTMRTRTERWLLAILFLVVVTSLPGPVQCAEDPLAAMPLRPFWVGADFGYGSLLLESDQTSGEREGTFALAFRGGLALGHHFRLGLEIDGWLLEGYNVWIPSEGASISNVMVVAELLPSRRVPAFVRLGVGRAELTDNAPDAAGGRGGSWLAAAGYEIGVTPTLGLVPTLGYATGDLGDSGYPYRVETGRRYSVWELRIGANWHLGKPSQLCRGWTEALASATCWR
jgi:hypothetical protein